MGKNRNGGDFQNKAARRFKNPEKIDLMPQEEIFDILTEDISVILDQVTKSRNHQGKYPVYVANAFANLSTALWFYLYVKDHVKVKHKKHKIKSDLSDDELESLRQLLSEAYKKSATNQYPQQSQEFKERNKIIGKTFIMLSPLVYHLSGKLNKGKNKLTKSQRRDLTIQVYGDPVVNMKFVHKIFNHSSISDKKKLKLLKQMYAERFIDAVGAALTIDNNNSDCISMLYDYVMGKDKLKKRAPYVLAYARAFKKNKSSNFRLTSGEFYKKNKKLIKELNELDIGFKKAFKNLKPTDKGAINPAKPKKKEKDKAPF